MYFFFVKVCHCSIFFGGAQMEEAFCALSQSIFEYAKLRAYVHFRRCAKWCIRMLSPVLPPSYVKLGRWSVQCWRTITNKTFSETPFLFCRSSLTNVEPASQISRVLAAFPGNLNRDCMIYISNDCLTIVWRLANLSHRLALHNVTIDRKDWKQMCSGIRELILSDVVISPNHQAESHYLAMARYVECLSVHLHSAQAFPPILWPNVRLLRIEALYADKYQLWLDQVLWCREMFRRCMVQNRDIHLLPGTDKVSLELHFDGLLPQLQEQHDAVSALCLVCADPPDWDNMCMFVNSFPFVETVSIYYPEPHCCPPRVWDAWPESVRTFQISTQSEVFFPAVGKDIVEKKWFM
jgi:hypothetical protein